MKDESPDSFGYGAREAHFRGMLKTFVGSRLTAVRVEVLYGQLNQVFLRLNERVVSIHGDIGGEVLKIVDTDSLPELGIPYEGKMIWQPTQAEPFIGKLIAAARVVGEAWDGHGLELAFERESTRTILITSVESPENDTQTHDALRVAFTNYLIELL